MIFPGNEKENAHFGHTHTHTHTHTQTHAQKHNTYTRVYVIFLGKGFIIQS